MKPSCHRASAMYCVYCRLSVSLTRFHSVVNSQKEKTSIVRVAGPVFVTRRRQISCSASSGMK